MFIRKPRYEISSELGDDSELGNESEHIGGYSGGDDVGFGHKPSGASWRATKTAGDELGNESEHIGGYGGGDDHL